MATKIIYNNWHPAVTIYHSLDERVSTAQLEAEGWAYAAKHFPGQACSVAAHLDAIEGDHVHVAVKEN